VRKKSGCEKIVGERRPPTLTRKKEEKGDFLPSSHAAQLWISGSGGTEIRKPLERGGKSVLSEGANRHGK